jgi:hypothetical protein
MTKTLASKWKKNISKVSPSKSDTECPNFDLPKRAKECQKITSWKGEESI